jgi:hypothetical protein
VVREDLTGLRGHVGSGSIPKAKSEAALLAGKENYRLSAHGVPVNRKGHGRSKSGIHTPHRRKSSLTIGEDWLSRTRASANALVQEAKGQSWLASRESSTALTQILGSDDDEDEGYEELAALSASQSNLQVNPDPLSPVAGRVRSPAWGSRYGSRNASRRTSRRGSISSLRAPMAGPGGPVGGYDGYSDETRQPEPGPVMGPDFVEEEEDESSDENSVSKLTGNKSFGLGGIVDRLMGFHLFNVEEHEETTEEETEEEREEETEDGRVGVGPGGSVFGETDAQAKERRERERARKEEEKRKLTALQPAPGGEDGDGAQGEPSAWKDAAWLLSVASKAMF